MLVMKFGGTSVADALRFEEVLDIVHAASNSDSQIGKVVVLSAMSGVTNGLIACAQEAQSGNSASALEKLSVLKERHLQVACELLSDHASAMRDEAGAFTRASTDSDDAHRANADDAHRIVGARLAEPALQLLADLEDEFSRLSVLLQGISYLGELSRRSLDAITSTGELLSTKIFSAYAASKGYPAHYLDARRVMVTNDDFGRAVPSMPELISACQTEILPLLDQGNWIITQGFIGATADGITTTLGRGGSDYTAALIGAAIEADEIQIWTDVDGMMTADPRLVPEARPIAKVSFQEAAELAYFGAKVLHPLTIKPAVEKNIPVRILNTLNPKSQGTLIMGGGEDHQYSKTNPAGDGKKVMTAITGNLETKYEEQSGSAGNGGGNGDAAAQTHVRAVACKKGLAAVFINSPRMLMATGFLAEVFSVFARHGTPIDLVATSEVSVSLTVDRLDQLPVIEKELRELGEVQVVNDLAIISIVGSRFKERAGITGQIFRALSGINIVMISFGASDINLSLVVASQDADDAIKLLHAEFFPAAVRCAAGI